MRVSQKVGSSNSSPKGSVSRGRADEETSDWEDAKTREKSPEAACRASQSRQAAGFEVQGGYWRVKPGTVRKGNPLSGPAPGETKSQLGFESGVLRRKTVKRTGPGPVATLKVPSPVVAIPTKLGLTQDLFARLIGVTQRSVSTWERGGEINDVSLRRVREMDRLADELRKSMREDFIPHWLVSPNEGLGGISPIEAMERGEGGRVCALRVSLGIGDSPLAIRHVQGTITPARKFRILSTY